MKNRCIMGGKGRGVFSDFRLGRVCCNRNKEESEANVFVVPVQDKRACWKPAWREEGKLVRMDGLEAICEIPVYYFRATSWHWAAFMHDLYKWTIIIHLWLDTWTLGSWRGSFCF